MIIGSATSCIFALTNAGVKYPWSSVEVIAPLTIGLAGFPIALLYDAYIASHPVVRPKLFQVLFRCLQMIRSGSHCYYQQPHQHLRVRHLPEPLCNNIALISVPSTRYISTFFHGLVVNSVVCM